jgi:anaerobic magnesium-protoporphyrin IX monomethyl ester cyclase
MKIALIKLPSSYAYKQPILGVSYISSYLKAHGHECRILDANFNSWGYQELIKKVEEYQPEIVGITAMTHEIVQAHQAAAALKEKNKALMVAVGGCHITALPKRTLEDFPHFDYGVYGEGEKTMLELVDKGVHGNLEEILGLVFRKSDKRVIVNPPRPELTPEELNSMPYPDFEEYYHSPRALAGKSKYYVLFSSRGCPFNCAFCMQVLGRKLRRRSAASIMGEIYYAMEKFAAHTIDFSDEIFLFNSKETRELLQKFIDSGLPERLEWSALTRANMVTADLIDMAKQAGCIRLAMGVESGNDDILRTINKKITVQQIERAAEIIRAAKIPLVTYYILGHPDETLDTVKQTVDLACRLKSEQIYIGLMVPYPGTQVFKWAQKGEHGYKLLSTDWAKYDKYGGQALELEGLPLRILEQWQRKALIKYYWSHLNIVKLISFLWKNRKGIIFLLFKRKHVPS